MGTGAASIWDELVGDPDSWRDVVEHYGDPRRAYHTLEHVELVLATLVDLHATEPAVLLAAILHDVIYDPRRSDNEVASARYAERVLAHLETAVVGSTAELILATATHDACPPGDHSCAALLDADLAILGAAPPVYDRYARAIREEYAHVPDDAYRAGRGALLEGFASRPRLFHLDEVHARLDAPARANLRREIGRLR